MSLSVLILVNAQVAAVGVELLSRYDSMAGFDAGGAEIIAYDPTSYKAFVTNGADKAVDILDISNPNKISLVKRISLEDLNIVGFKADDITSVAVHPDRNYIAVAISAEPKTRKGRVAFLNIEGNLLGTVGVGSLPDMLTFTPDGKMLLVANEGEPGDDYIVDPIGSVSIIDLNNGMDRAVVVELGFDFITADKIQQGIRIFGPNTTLARDMEPEYIVVSPDSMTAYVVLQENNALAKIDLKKKRYEYIYSFGFKDHSLPGNKLDASNRDYQINIRNWPLLGMYLPDGIDLFVDNGEIYIITANEGDARDYDGFSEEIRAKDIANIINLKANYYQGYSQSELDRLMEANLFSDVNLGRIKLTNTLGKNEEGIYEALYSYGTRSFSIWKPTNLGLELVFDSGSDFEEILARELPDYFNTNNDKTEMDGRSDDKGPEPEDVKVGIINGRRYAFIGLERISGFMVYDITNPSAPVFEMYVSSRDYSVQLADYEKGELMDAGDVAPEGLRFIPVEESPTGMPLLLIASEVSGTVGIFEITN